eukprot:225943-Prymnesium_polylepis.1
MGVRQAVWRQKLYLEPDMRIVSAGIPDYLTAVPQARARLWPHRPRSSEARERRAQHSTDANGNHRARGCKGAHGPACCATWRAPHMATPSRAAGRRIFACTPRATAGAPARSRAAGARDRDCGHISLRQRRKRPLVYPSEACFAPCACARAPTRCVPEDTRASIERGVISRQVRQRHRLEHLCAAPAQAADPRHPEDPARRERGDAARDARAAAPLQARLCLVAPRWPRVRVHARVARRARPLARAGQEVTVT